MDFYDQRFGSMKINPGNQFAKARAVSWKIIWTKTF